MRILIVESEPKLANKILCCLSGEGFIGDIAANWDNGFSLATSYRYDLVILVILDLPHPDGFDADLLRRLRQQHHNVPILVLSECNELEAKIETFEAGADDYLTNPFDLAELLARVRALLRRGPAVKESILKLADLELDRLTRRVRRAGQRIDLSPKEYSLLEYFLLNPGRILSRSMIIDQVWDQPFEGFTNIVDAYIRHFVGRSMKNLRRASSIPRVASGIQSISIDKADASPFSVKYRRMLTSVYRTRSVF